MHKSLKSLSLSLINAGHVSLDGQWDYDHVISPFNRLYYITEGFAKIWHSGKTFALKPGFIYLIPSFTYSRYKCDQYMVQYYASFFEEMANGLSIYNLKSFQYEVQATDLDLAVFKRLIKINPERALVNIDPKVYDNYPTLLTFEKQNEKLNSAEYLETQGLLLTLFSRFILEHHGLTNNNSLTSQKIVETVYHIHENLKNELTVDQLAKKCHMNVDHYSRSFKELFGIRPVNYIQMQRIRRAQSLLSTTTITIPEIATEIGLSNLSYFSRLFKRLTGKAPGEFRKYQWRV